MPKQYPLLSQENTFLPKGTNRCPQCGQIPSSGELPMVMNGGALQKDGPDSYSMTPPDIHAFWDLSWHSHLENDAHAFLEVACLTQGGQFEFCFCSPACLRAFFNELVDDFEQELANSRR